ncbi:MAG TPA: hypothetical protein VE736_02410, partial [Gaiellaceae bacterium]|nr:hypothetical protein [Gaiellaceae bacterium]
ATAALALRTAVLPRWFAWISIVAGFVLLFAVVFIPVFVYWGWVVVAGVLLAWRRPAAEATAATAR